MAMQLDLCSIMDGAAPLGHPHGRAASGTAPRTSLNPPNVIGSDSIAPLSMAAAFAAFAANGTYCTPIAIISVLGRRRRELPVPAGQLHAGDRARSTRTP